MATEKNITMKQFNGTDYDTLYPKTKVEQVEGAYTQQQILADSTKTLFGLGTDAVPNQVLKFLGQFNLHQWKRRKVTKKLVKTTVSQVASSRSDTAFYVHYTDVAPYVTNDFSDSSVKWGSNPTYFGGGAAQNTTTQMTNTLKNCYWTPTSGNHITPESPKFYSGSSARFSSTTSNSVVTVTGTDTVQLSCQITYSDWEILKSADRNKYQDSGMSNPVAINDGYECYEYVYLGNPYELLIMLPQTSAAAEAANADVKLRLQQADDTAIELYEAYEAQEAINAAQDDALIEIYELNGG